MARILSVSYNEALLLTRQMLLTKQGYQVVSAIGFEQAMRECETGQFDLFILGHSIPLADKKKLVETFRSKCDGPVLALRKASEQPLESADHHLVSENPQELQEKVAEILRKHASAASE